MPSVDLLGQFWNEPLDYSQAPVSRSPTRSIAARIVAAATCLIIGLLLTTAYRRTTDAAPAVAEARAELRADIDAQREHNAELEETTIDLRAEVRERRDDLLGGADEVEQLHLAEALAGFRPVQGDGATVTITAGSDDEGRIYDRDIQLVVNTLWAYGAEAISVNGQRLTATTTIRQAGGSILVDFSPIASPFTVEAIGPDRIASRFSTSSIASVLRDLARHGVTVDAAETDNMTLPAADNPDLAYATVEED